MKCKFKSDRILDIKSNQFHSLGAFGQKLYHVLPGTLLTAFKSNQPSYVCIIKSIRIKAQRTKERKRKHLWFARKLSLD